MTSSEPVLTSMTQHTRARVSTEVWGATFLLDVFYTSEASICIAVCLEITGAP